MKLWKTIALPFALAALLSANPNDTTATDTVTELSLEEEMELLDLDLLVSDEVASKKVVETPDSTEADTTAADSATAQRSGPVGSHATMINSGPRVAKNRKPRPSKSTGKETKDTTISAETAAFTITEANIDEAGHIDFQKNVTEYRSPRKAMLLSLAVPGLGQAYTHKRWKSAIFGALEVSFIVGAIKFKKDGEEQTDDAHAYADLHYKTENLDHNYAALLNSYVQESNFSKEDAEKSLFWAYPDSTYAGYKKQFLTGDFYDKDQGIGSEAARLGWTDVTPFSITPLVNDEGKQAYDIRYGYSYRQLKYISKVDKAGDYHDYSKTFVIGIFVNHIASAVDAFITAKRFNRKLLSVTEGEEVSTRPIDRLHLDHGFVLTDAGLKTKVGLQWRF